MKMLFVSAVIALTTVSGAATAQTSNSLGSTTQSDGMIYNFDYQTLAPLLTQFGYAHEAKLIDGKTFIRITDGNTITVLTPRVCRGADGSGCVGLIMEGYFNGALTGDQNNEFNLQTPFAAVETRGTASVVERYLISDFGFSRQTLEVELAVFQDVIVNFSRFHTGYLQSVDYQVEDPTQTDSKLANQLESAPVSSPHGQIEAAAVFPDAFNDGKAFRNLVD